MFGRKKQLCVSCKTGKESYELDSHSETCPYIYCYNVIRNKCRFYKPLETEKAVYKQNIRCVTPQKEISRKKCL